MAYPRFQRSRQHKFVRSSSGNTAINTSSAWADLSAHVASFTDLTLAECQEGDTVLVSIAGMWGNDSPSGRLDFATIVSSSVTTLFSSGTSTPATNGLVGGYNEGTDRTGFGVLTGFLELSSGDIEDGSVTIRPRVFTAGSKTFHHDQGWWGVQNLGPAQE